MESFGQRESVSLGYSPQRSSENSPDVDFSDVFGGPPRRYSNPEGITRYSFSEASQEASELESDAPVLPRNPWSLSDEKPVFGAESVHRRTHGGDDFFDDIFKGGESKSFDSPSRSLNRDFYGSSPGYMALSPSRPLPSMAEPLSSSVPTKFSLPSNVTKIPFGSSQNDGNSNVEGNGHTLSPSASISRLSSLTKELQEDISYDTPLYRKSPLSQQVSNNINQESTKGTKLGEENIETNLKSSEREVQINSGQFHFSIYKWPGSGVPLLMALAGGSSKSRFRDRLRAERCTSSNGRIESESKSNGTHFPIFNEPKSVPLTVDSVKKEKADLKISETNVSASEGNDTAKSEAVSKKNTEEGSHSNHKRDKKRAPVKKGKTLLSEQKPLHVLLTDDDDQEQGQAPEGKDIKVKSTNTKKNGPKSAPTIQKPETNLGDAFGGSRVKGKVGDFVKLFDHDSSETIKNVFGGQSSRWKKVDVDVKDDGVRHAFKNDEKVHVSNKAKMPAESSSKKEDNVFNKSKVKQEPYSKKSTRKTSVLSTNEKKDPLISDSSLKRSSLSYTELRPSNYGVEVEDRDEAFPGFFSVEEVSKVEENVSEISEESDHIQTSNAKIQQWSSGRKGNIRSLLSTLQFVLWPESGWKPVPLVDLIEGSTVKRAYQRALLCLHPDKLQQKGAAPHQKYLAQQVFEILQEAWDLFNSLGAI